MQNVNYAGFVELLTKYEASGLRLIGFSCNQFGAQAPSSSECERAYFYHKLNRSYDVTANPTFDKVDVNGEKTHEVYEFLKTSDHSAWPGFHDLKWNYEKFLVDGAGVVQARLRSPTSPTDFEDKIKTLLGLSGDSYV